MLVQRFYEVRSAKRSFAALQKIVTLGSNLTFAALCADASLADKPAIYWRSEYKRSILSRLQQSFYCDAAYVVETDIQPYRFQ